MYVSQSINFDRINAALLALVTHCEMIEHNNAERDAKLAQKLGGNFSPAERLRWSLESNVQAVIEREHVEALLEEWQPIAHAHALEMEGGPMAKPMTYDAVVEFVLRWARFAQRTVAEGVNVRDSLADQLVVAARVKHCRRMLEALQVMDADVGLSEDDMRAVFEARAQREAAQLRKPKRCEVKKMAGGFTAFVFDGYGDRIAESVLRNVTRKGDALAAANLWLASKGIHVAAEHA